MKTKSEKMAKEQAQLNRKKGEIDGTTPGKVPADKNGNGTRLERLKTTLGEKHFWTILLVVVGLFILLFGLCSSSFGTPHLAEVGSWSRSRWLWILIFAGILYALVALNSENLGKAAGVLQAIISVAVFMFFIGFQVIAWFTSPNDTATKQASIPLASVPPLKGQLTVSANVDSAHLETKPGHVISFTGSGFTTHCVYRDGHEGIVGDSEKPCGDGPMLAVYVHDETGKENTVSYAYVQP